MSKQKRAVAIHDISCFGRCSLTVALPILSAAGIETPVIPTAVLSTHTGGFTGFTYRDMTEDIRPVVEHWMRLGLGFDAIYTGYLGSIEQVELIRQVIDLLRGEQALVVVDPVMGDLGVLYAGFPEGFPQEMRTLCAKADVVVPNLTEAALLLDRPYTERPDAECVHALLHGLCDDLGARSAVLTGVSLTAGELGAATYDADNGAQSYAGAASVKGMYHGSGDVFSSALVAGLVRGLSLAEAAERAVTFTVEAIRRTHAAGTEPRYGLNFEAGLAAFGQQFH